MSFSAKISILTFVLLGLAAASLVGETQILLKGGEGSGGVSNLPASAKFSLAAQRHMLLSDQKPEDFKYRSVLTDLSKGVTVNFPSNLRGATVVMHGNSIVFSATEAGDALQLSKANLDLLLVNGVRSFGMLLTNGEYASDLLFVLDEKSVKIYIR